MSAAAVSSVDLSSVIRPGDGLIWGQACAEPQTLVEAVVAQRSALSGCRIFLGSSYSGLLRPEHADHLRLSSYCGTGTNRAYAISVFDGSPVIDRNNDNVLTTDERSQDLRQSGIAPEAAFLVPAPAPNGNLNSPNGGTGQVTCLSGVEVLNVCTKFNQRVKTYWREGMAN